MGDSERQSCSLMACKVISCGLVKLKAASLGCNSWQSCPPFTLANPSFRAFSHNQRFMERSRKREVHGARKQMMTKKKRPTVGWHQGRRMLWEGFMITTVSHSLLLYNYSRHKHGSWVALSHSNVVAALALVPCRWIWHAAFPVWYPLSSCRSISKKRSQLRGINLNLFIYLNSSFSLPLFVLQM